MNANPNSKSSTPKVSTSGYGNARTGVQIGLLMLNESVNEFIGCMVVVSFTVMYFLVKVFL